MTHMTPNTDTPAQAYHYGVIARAIALIDAAPEPLGLEALAAQLGMSAAHFQRLFSIWAGVSPKRYQQYLALGHAKTLLRERFTTLAAAQTAGLSGTGRLHDLFVRWEAMSPGEFATGGKGLAIVWGWFDTPFGAALVMGTDKGICGLSFAAQMGEAGAMADLRERWPVAQFTEDPARLRPWVRAAFGMGTTPDRAPLYLIGAPFQIKVWEALLHLPEGQVTTYGAIASAIGSPKAVRAVGTAVGRNPVGYLIPCHRVLRKSGELGGYHWGLPMKRAMLGYEAARVDARTDPNTDENGQAKRPDAR
jgi:AraC family transcriptional regulator of adaptative response/methylated-DNA-[protein]-cysteine methyltransferase